MGEGGRVNHYTRHKTDTASSFLHLHDWLTSVNMLHEFEVNVVILVVVAVVVAVLMMIVVVVMVDVNVLAIVAIIVVAVDCFSE